MSAISDVRYFWHEAPVPAGLEVTQVYGWLLCPSTGRVLIQEHDDGTFNLPGGGPEEIDSDWLETLKREAFEENQVRIRDRVVYLGYQEVCEPGRFPSLRSGWPASSPNSRRGPQTQTAAHSTGGA